MLQKEVSCSHCGHKNPYDKVTIVEVLDGILFGFCFFCGHYLVNIYRYDKGWKPIPDSVFGVFTIKKDEFIKVGDIFVSGKLVGEEMDNHHSIKGYTPERVAKKLARMKYPEVNPIIVI